jgi:lipoyl synthase
MSKVQVQGRVQAGVKLRDDEKVKHIPITILPTEKTEMLRKPNWIKIKLPSNTSNIDHIKNTLRKNNLHSVCEEASCPNLAECFNHGTATFMILGDICTRRCPFCDVAHGKPLPPSAEEPIKLAKTIAEMRLKYVVITSVDRDDLRDGGAQHFVDCINAIRLPRPYGQSTGNFQKWRS